MAGSKKVGVLEPVDTPLAKREGIYSAFQEHQAALRRFISRFVRRNQDIDDVAQETFLRAFRAEQERDKAIEMPKSYLFRVAHNVAVYELTRKSNQIYDSLEDVDESTASWREDTLEDEIMAKQVIGLRCEAIALLPPQCRRVFLMRKVHGMSHREIAERLNIATKTVEKHISKGVRDSGHYVRLRQAGASIGEAQASVVQPGRMAQKRGVRNG